ncbi:MAG TPA: SDR family NAD(P)-dependent oxidoreductase [Chloroflexota bacterium]|nr:SDR family NAD(P)-dependent oxidoreductase [Chloroflexota bacterium]
MDLQLSGKTALVTGGSMGIGKAVARALADEGVDVAILARTKATLQAAADELERATGRRILAVPADTSRDDSVREAAQQVVEAFGHIDILVNCAAQPAGQGPAPTLAEVTDEAFFGDVNTKVMGYLRCIQAVAPHMKSQGWGRIINISGMAARTPASIIGSIRNVSVVAMTKNVAEQLGPFGINVTVVHPGMTRTEKTAALARAAAEQSGSSVEEAEKRRFGGNLLGRAIDASDIAAVVTFLASPRAVAINGDVIAAAGGTRGAIHY